MEPIIKINLRNIADNYKKIRDFCKKNVIAVIKDNAYGHSLIQVAKTLANNNVYMLAVSSLNEAISLRKNMIFSPVLLLGRCDDARTLFSMKIIPGISSLDQLRKLSKENIPLPIHLEIETGMHRLGISSDELEEALTLIKNSHLKLKGIYTHFCTEECAAQKGVFEHIVRQYFDAEKLIVHAQASSFLGDSVDCCNAVRTGLALYGYSRDIPLKPALKLICPVIRTEEIEAGEPIGYDFTEKTPSKGYILTLPFGYSTGLSRIKKLSFIYRDKTYYQIGKSCMDITMFFSEDKIESGTEIELISEANINALISVNNESVYYLLSSLSPNIKRIFK